VHDTTKGVDVVVAPCRDIRHDRNADLCDLDDDRVLTFAHGQTHPTRTSRCVPKRPPVARDAFTLIINLEFVSFDPAHES
jgi:hypothetical protein